MIHFGSACQVATQSHCDGAGCYFCQPRYPDQMVLALGYGAAEAGGQGKGNGEAVGHTDDDVGEAGRTLHVLLFVSMVCVMAIRGRMVCRVCVGPGMGPPPGRFVTLHMFVILRLVGSCPHISS